MITHVLFNLLAHYNFLAKGTKYSNTVCGAGSPKKVSHPESQHSSQLHRCNLTDVSRVALK